MSGAEMFTSAFAVGLLVGAGAVALMALVLWWRQKRSLRKELARQQRSTLKGQIAEQLAPWWPGFPYQASDARFLGAPIDLVVFDGLSDDAAEVSVVLVELKTGKAKLSKNERRVKAAVQAKRVRFETIRLPGDPAS